MTSIDVVGLLDDALRQNDWGQDGLLHASSDLVGSLRHSQLRLAGAPKVREDLTSLIRMRTGTMWHEYLGDAIASKGVPVMREVPADAGMPEGWAGTADLLVWDAQYSAFVLYDLKTTKGEGMRYILRDGAKTEHIWQASSYWHSFVAQGYPMLDTVGIIYLPMNQVYGDEPVEPSIQWVKPLPEATVLNVMTDRWDKTQAYLNGLEEPGVWGALQVRREWRPAEEYLTHELEPTMPREQRLYKNKDKWEVKLVPHWSAQFCPYPDELCDCSSQGVTKVGEFVWWNSDATPEWTYLPRSGYENIEPVLAPK